MIGRGSRVRGDKKKFKVIDLGNNAVRFGPWSQPVDWQHIFKNPDFYLDNLRNDDDIEREFIYAMPDSLKKRFKKNPNDDFDIKTEYKKVTREGSKSMQAIENSIAQHSILVIANSEDVFEARELSKLLHDDICYRIKQYCYCIMNSTKNYKEWLLEEYIRKLRLSFNGKF